MEEDILRSIDRKFDSVIKILAGNIIQGKTKTDAILVLGALGLETSVIAEMVGTTVMTVNVRLWEQRKKKVAITKKAKSSKEEK